MFTVGKCKVMHIRTRNPSYMLMESELAKTEKERDLGFVMDSL